MKFVLNACYGGFGLSDFALEALGVENKYALKRNDPKLVELVETYGSEKVSSRYAELVVEEIPDTTTDWTIQEYDGSETLIYVVDGKLHYA